MSVKRAEANAVSVESAAAPFATDVERVVLRLRSALAGVFGALPRPVRGGTDLQRELGLPSTLSWQLHGFVSAADPVALAAQIPGRHATTRALTAARAKGVPKSLIERGLEAFDEFEACVQRHAGSRAEFASMLGALAAVDSSGVDAEARRDAFRASSHIYGVQLGLCVNCYLLHPGRVPDRLDFVLIHGFVRLRVVRPFDKLVVGRFGHIADNPGPEPAPVQSVGEPTPGLGGVSVLDEFSSSPLPRFLARPGPRSSVELYISGPTVGRTGEQTFFVAEHWPAAAPLDEELGFRATIMHPSEAMLHDVLLAPGIARRGLVPKTDVYGGALEEVRGQYRETDRLKPCGQSAFAGAGVDSLQTTLVPRYVEMLHEVCRRVGWDGASFETYRLHAEYPVLHSLTRVAFPAPGVGGRAGANAAS